MRFLGCDRTARWLLVAVLAPWIVHTVAAQESSKEQAAAQAWVQSHFQGPVSAVPFSFRYGDRRSADLLGQWEVRSSVRPLDRQRTQRELSYTDPATGLVVRCVAIQYAEFPTIEWTPYFRNTSGADSPIVSDIQAVDTGFPCGTDEPVVLHHHKGSLATPDDYRPHETPLEAGVPKRITALGGRPSNSDLPYFNLEWPGRGVMVVVGWPGQWAARFARAGSGGIVLQAGQEQTRFRLRAGEEVRTPLIVLQFWHGDWVSAQNLWRRWMVAHNLPRPGGQLAPPQLVACNSHQFNEMLGANEQNQKLFIDRYLANGLKIDYWWMDAGWYKNSGTWVNTGTWEVDPKRFPGGLRAITDHGHAKGVKSIVWFEPERVTPGTWLYDRHPEWLLRASPDLNDPLAGLGSRRATELPGTDPCVTHNPTSKTRSVASVRWEPGRLAFHPGPQGEYSVVRWTGLTTGEYAVQAEFLAIDEQTTTDVHVLHGGRSVFTDRINLDGRGRRAVYEGTLKLAQGGTLDFVVGWGNGTHASDSTGLAAVLRDPTGKTHDAAKDFHLEANPNGPWSYGYLKPGPTPDSSTFRPYDHHETIGDNGWRLLNLGDLAARTWLTDHVDRLIRDQGIDLYRQDFNIDPLPYWRSADAEDRQGITEIRYVEGYLAYWDELRRRHPTMLIDSCASGGRRNDLETLRRAVPLVRSDHLFEPTSQQCHTYGISFWYPYHGTGTLAGESKILNAADAAVQQFDVYAFRSHMAASVTACWDVRRDDLDYAELRRLAGQLRTVQPCYLGDYYPLTTYSTANDAWMAWQFDLPQQGCGMVQAFRRPQSTQAGACYKLLGLDAQATYVVRDLDTPDQPAERSGGELMQDGLAVSILKQPGAAVVTYQKK